MNAALVVRPCQYVTITDGVREVCGADVLVPKSAPYTYCRDHWRSMVRSRLAKGGGR